MTTTDKRNATAADIDETAELIGRIAIQNHENRFKRFKVERDGTITVKRQGAKCLVLVHEEHWPAAYGIEARTYKIFTAIYR